MQTSFISVTLEVERSKAGAVYGMISGGGWLTELANGVEAIFHGVYSRTSRRYTLQYSPV